ncbi:MULTISPECIES: hypothetical protein [unclassified Isoptericola]|uniref:hypothetical protein n=1 Tax=unclassified Isoptericola TaxID=2623355 RepID=UPI00365A37E2
MSPRRASTAAAVILGALAGCAPPGEVGASPGVVVAMAEESFPTSAAVDWVTYADHVVVVTVVDEAERARSREDGNPAGERYVEREVALRVDERLWSSADPRHRAPPDRFSMEAAGSLDRDGDRTPWAVEDTPRMERGHTYVVALVWRPAVPDPTTPTPAHWAWLGTDALLPYDDGTIGVGELEGVVRAAPRVVPEGDPERSFEDAMAGRSAADLAAVLRATRPVEREDYG